MADRRSKPVWFEGAREGSILGHPVKVPGPQTPGGSTKHIEGSIEVDGNVTHYEVGPRGIHSHSHMYADFATPWELAEALVRDYGALAVRGGPSAEVAPHDHGGHAHPAKRRKGRR
jgi:hypothetical protein